jgi:two-component system KDP operon response regulator KdpE
MALPEAVARARTGIGRTRVVDRGTAAGSGSPEKRWRVLVIDDEEQIRRALTSVLGTRGFDVATAATAAEGLAAAAERTPDLIVLDLSLPDVDGLEVARELRNWLPVPILVLSVRSDEADKIDALNSGADDYMVKPFSAGELLARARALMRRAHGAETQPSTIVVADLSIDLARRRVSVGGTEVKLTRTEFDLLAYLARHLGCVVTSSMILENVWGPEYRDDTQALRVHISNLRHKIEQDPAVPRRILTEHGVGFVLTDR